MRVSILDTVTMSYQAVPDSGETLEIKAQPGLTIISEFNVDHGSRPGKAFKLSFTAGATIDLPGRLAQRLIEIGYAKVPSRRIRRPLTKKRKLA